MEELEKQVSEVFHTQQKYFREEHLHLPVSSRKKQLRRLQKWILENQEDICAAVQNDFKKPTYETRISEIYPSVSAIRHALANIDQWSRPKKVSAGLGYMYTKSQISHRPKGVSLIISPWNYPFMLAVEPLISAISAGCTVILKPSEFTPATSELLQKMVNEVFIKKEVAVFTGDYTVSQALLQHPFNHIFFTGSPAVGKIIMKAAAEHLTSVTLELGGMNSAVIDESVNLNDAAEKILWAKAMNAGQTCVSVNEIYIHESVKEEFVEALHRAKEKLYPNGYQLGKEHAAIVNPKNFTRVKGLLDEALAAGSTLEFGGESDEANLFLEPTFISGVPSTCGVKNEEIFAPLVVINTYSDVEEALQRIANLPIPLAAYVFSKNRAFQKRIKNGLQAGTFCVNETTIQFAHPELPFGGHGNSGVGKGHGHYGFLEFTNQRAELKQRTGFTSAKLIYPPYDKKWKNWLANALIKWF